MGLLDRFRSKKERIGKDKKPKHVVAKSAKDKAAEEKRRRFAAVPGAGVEAKKKSVPTAPDLPDARLGGRAAAGEPPRRESKKHAPAKRKEDSGDAYKVLLRPLVSEKSTSLAINNQYVFVVANDANKISVRKAVQSLYGVRPQKVNVMNIAGKFVRYGRTQGATKHWKKAVVTLQPGQKLDVYGG